ncbi:alpha-L-rhamnosidase C-terminal domain-containing protein [Cerasicoccus maritimus]|uniref:alpha-L-rhamnosidase-related protein n=1 Tax=Cerasicoccus maritimus TaxID=490089 RepID=UPI002852839D|nr:alpha-L-rhamnosidase C-terminal domain-containing protein [Cerasicoccus maritimus]
MSHPDFRYLSAPIERLSGDANLQVGHPAERASWVWAPNVPSTGTVFLEFSLEFDWAEEERPLDIHVTADQRFQLYLDGEDIAFGPDRCDILHWSVSSLRIPVSKGRHQLKALVWTLPLASEPTPSPDEENQLVEAEPIAPMGQMSYRGGFLLCAAELSDFEVLNTGLAPWRVRDISDAVSLKRIEGLSYHDIGPSFTINLQKWNSIVEPTPVVEIRAPLKSQKTGVLRQGWVLDNTYIPEQARIKVAPGKVRGLRSISEDAWTESSEASELTAWQALLCNAKQIEIPANSAIEVLWDFEEYLCGYPYLEATGAGATIEIEWAESLYHWPEGEVLEADCPKGNRSEIAGKYWLGFGDVFELSSLASKVTTPLIWWRSGRYLRVRFRTGNDSLSVTRLQVVSTGYPIRMNARWQSSDVEWDGIMQLMAKGLEFGAHETWTDCPYYEQMMYVGDTRLHGLSNYACYEDDRLTRRAIELFDWSRIGSAGELVSERYPCHLRQECSTYAMMWVWMVHDFLMWRDDFDFVRARLPGMRSLLESLLPLITKEGVLGPIPGWPFVDWERSWDTGCGPGVREGDSSILSLHLVITLKAAADIEAAVGEPLMQQRYLEKAEELIDAVMRLYWDSERNLFLDSRLSSQTSEHAQVLALLTGMLSEEHEAACLDALLNTSLDAHCTIYFSHYLLEVLTRYGQSEAYFDKLKFWRELPAQGFVSLPEAPEPSRSDCHGWGAHPMFHSFASVAGVRPAEPAFAKIRVQPMPGPLEHFRVVMPHPRGEIVVSGKREAGRMRIDVAAPAGIEIDLDECYCI